MMAEWLKSRIGVAALAAAVAIFWFVAVRC